LVAVTVAIPNRNLRTAAFVDVSWTVADVTDVKFSDTLVYVVANAISIRISSTSTTTNA
jgi:hypothetical protein